MLLAKQNYKTHDAKLLAIVEGFNIWHYYLKNPITLFGSYKPQKSENFYSFKLIKQSTNLLESKSFII